MRTFPVRKWIRSQVNTAIMLTMNDVARIGRNNTDKILLKSKTMGKKASIINQYSNFYKK